MAMTEHRYCRYCQKKTDHDTYKDLFGMGERSNVAERLFFGMMTLGASEAIGTTRRECQECGTVTTA